MTNAGAELDSLVLNPPPKEATMVLYYGDLVSQKQSMELCSYVLQQKAAATQQQLEAEHYRREREYPELRPLIKMLREMRAEGNKFPNLGEACRRVESRKYVESKDVTSIVHKQITGAKAQNG